jgi:phosphoribosyl 1,2-cyclic phosphodiesterase
MLVRVWGCRGSIAAPGPDTVKYGGNTSCVEVQLRSGHVLVLDAGTGMRALGVAMQHQHPPEIHVLLTHLHLDHLQGLGFFRPLFQPGRRVHLWGPKSPVQNLAQRISIYLSPPLFPVQLDDVGAHLTFHDAPETAVTIGSATVRAALVTHQGPTLGYRIEEDGRSLVYLPDHEPGLGTTLKIQPNSWMSGYDIARGADVLLHDAQYLDEEYPNHVGWGHSSIGDALEFASKSDVGRVVLFHHDPYHTDAELEALLDEAHAAWPGSTDRVALASEGMTIMVDEAGIELTA